MKSSVLWSLRLGFSAKQADFIEKNGVNDFLEKSFATTIDDQLPDYLAASPKTLSEFKELRQTLKDANSDQAKAIRKQEAQTALEMKMAWIEKMQQDAFPLREKMTCFWHNHFVSTIQKVKVNYWIYQHNQILRKHAFGNFKTLTKLIVQSNAMVRYLDNVDNRKGKWNENLSRELLELFTLGIGNYTEMDIKNGAKGLAGLGIGEEKAQYRKFLEDNEPFTYLGKKGNLKADQLIDAIFEQKAIPYLITRKILQWFIYDDPSEDLVQYYGDYFRKVNFEVQPLLVKMITEEYDKKTAGSKIKNPLEFSLQLLDELQIKNPNTRGLVLFMKEQGMDLFNQPNVKGWDGGNSWLSSQMYLQRNNVADLLCNGRGNFRNQNANKVMNDKPMRQIPVQLKWDKNASHKKIIAQLSDRLLFQVEASTQADFEKIIKYDFDSNATGADYAVLRLFNYMVKSPEFQLI